MSARTGMMNIIFLVQRLIDDESGDYHTYDEIQDALDQRRQEARYLTLDALKTIAEGGTVTYVTFIAPQGLTHWEETGTLVDSDYAALTPSTSDWASGRWTFSSEPTRPVRLSGYSYDVYAAAADLLEVRASMVAEDIQSFSGQNGSFSFFGGKRASVLAMAAQYRRKQRVKNIDLIRDDVNILV